MLYKAPLLTVTFALMAAASPATRAGIRIPLQKRSSLTKADGTFDHDKAVLQLTRVQKYVLLSFAKLPYVSETAYLTANIVKI